ncbi:MAG: hypothetical protein EBZ77_03570 [Chitinophagia bacterium]|nr:hypothetical protein [Chitinophagia bacterium]
MATNITPLVIPTLDPRTEATLVEYALDRVYTASGGTLNSFAASSPARALIEGQAFAGAELLYYLNQLPEAMALAYLQIAGIQQILGTSAIATLTFTLTAPLTTAYTIPIGYEVSTSGNLKFTTDTNLIISAGNISGTVTATAAAIGSTYNVGAYTITRLSQALAYLASVTNTEPASGGTDGETVDQTKSRAFAAIRRRGLISADDYEEETRSLLGPGSIAKAIGNLAADKVSTRAGSVHVFCLNPDGQTLSTAQLGTIQAALQAKSNITIAVYTSSVDVQDITVRVVAKLPSGQNPQTLADDINDKLSAYLKPGNLPLGETILVKELEYLVRLSGVETVQSVILGLVNQSQLAANLALPYSYSAGNMLDLVVELVDGSSIFSYAYGQGDPD